MPEAQGIKASLISNGTLLTEYPSSPNTPLIVFCESVTGQTFVVKVSGTMPNHDVTARLYIDGVCLDGGAYRHTSSHAKTKWVFRGVRPPNDLSKCLPYKFVNIKLTDQDPEVQDVYINNLGTVAMKLYKCAFGHRAPRPNHPVPRLAADQEFPEKHKKKISHTVALGEAFSTSHNGKSHCHQILSSDQQPYLEFTWKYRSRAVLLAQEIISNPDALAPSVCPPHPAENNPSSLYTPAAIIGLASPAEDLSSQFQRERENRSSKYLHDCDLFAENVKPILPPIEIFEVVNLGASVNPSVPSIASVSEETIAMKRERNLSTRPSYHVGLLRSACAAGATRDNPMVLEELHEMKPSLQSLSFSSQYPSCDLKSVFRIESDVKSGRDSAAPNIVVELESAKRLTPASQKKVAGCVHASKRAKRASIHLGGNPVGRSVLASSEGTQRDFGSCLSIDAEKVFIDLT